MSVSSFEEVLWRLKRLQHEETRRESEDYLEFITLKESLKGIHLILDGYFGAAVKPAGIEPSEDVALTAERYGGITRDQTLYFAKRADEANLAMIWPWRDGRRVTVKVIQGEAEEAI